MLALTGHDHDVLEAGIAFRALTAIRASSCKLMFVDGDGEHRELPFDGCDGVVRFQATHCHMHLERVCPELARTLLPRDLDALTIDRANAYLSPAGSGAALHFDVRTVVIVQLVGHKVWELSEHPAVERPTVNCVAPTRGGHVTYEGRRLTVPTRLVPHRLSPGDWLVVPKATWHRTATPTGSVSVTLACPE